MNTGRVRISQQKHEMSPNVVADYEWLHQNRKALYQKYGACVILVYQQQVIGTGATVDEAVLNAEKNLPDSVRETVTPITEVLGNQNFFFRVRAIERES